jgi:hypothetical protein
MRPCRSAAMIVGALLCSLAGPRTVAAQGAELPPTPGARTIVGVVMDAAARPLEDAEVRIVGTDRTARTRHDGSFRFDSVGRGKHDLRARRLGYEPQTRKVNLGDKGVVVTFNLKVIPQALQTVVTSASRGGLGGIITDMKLRPLPGVAVRVFGGSARTLTDSAGEFFMDVRPGSFMVRITKSGHAGRLVSVTIPRDSGRRIAIALAPGKAASAREEIAMREFAHRLAWRVSPAVFYSREKLEWFSNKRLEPLIRNANGMPIADTCMAVVNGGPDSAPLWYFDTDELEAVEVYPPMLAFGRDRQGGAIRTCPGVYIWTRR